MILRYFSDDRLAQASYLVGCAKTGEALVIDPMREIAPYLKRASAEGLRIAHVTETHIHADFVSGSRELARATGATLWLSDMGDADWKYAFAGEPHVRLLHDGDGWMVGRIRIEALHTPGHTPEHLAFVLTDTAASTSPMGVFTGDFLFAGDVGRPDLLEEAAGYVGTKEVGARTQFQTLQRFRRMPDYLQVWPGHSAGSACGKALGAVPSTTVGYERLCNPAFQYDDEESFVRWLLSGQPEPPRYFAQMKRVNKAGPAFVADLPMPERLDRLALDGLLAEGAQVFDLRNREDFSAAHVPATIGIPASETTYSTWLGWFVDYSRPTYLILPSPDALTPILSDLRAIGVDWVGGWFGPEVTTQDAQALPMATVVEAAQAHAAGEVLLIDVRGHSEFAERRVAGARNIPVGHLPLRLAELPRDKPIVTLCASGYRAQIAASVLQAAGFQAAALSGGEDEWSQAFRVERG